MSVATFIEWFMAIFLVVTMTLCLIGAFVSFYKYLKED